MQTQSELHRARRYAHQTGIDLEIVKRYFAHRKPYVSKYFRGVVIAPAQGSFRCAKRGSEIDAQWERLEALNMVRLRYVPDEDASYQDMCGDTHDIKTNADSVHGGARTIIAQEKAFKAKLERDGVWGCIGEFTLDDCEGYSRCKEPHSRRCDECECGAEWQQGDSLWCLEGTDDYGYQTDIKAATIEALKEALRNRPVISKPNRLRAAV